MEREPFVPPDYENLAPVQKRFIDKEMYDASVELVQNARGVDISRIHYESDGLNVTGLEVLPKFKPDEKGPMVIFNRGGNREFGALTAGVAMRYMVPFARRMNAGVLASNYRGNDGGEGREQFGGDDINDVINLIEEGKKQPWWDGRNIFMFGWSRGGMMTYLAAKSGADLNAAAIGAGVTDLFRSEENRPEMAQLHAELILDYDTKRDEELQKRSAVCWPEKIKTPILLLHGDADNRVDVRDAREMNEKLSEQGTDVKYIEFTDGDHGLRNDFRRVIDEVVQWFERYREKAPQIEGAVI